MLEQIIIPIKPGIALPEGGNALLAMEADCLAPNHHEDNDSGSEEG